MTGALGLPESPYKGLSYYSEQDAPFFFGRGRETQIVIANLMASRLTLLYGESGVGKSSLLRAGAARELHELARENIDRRGTPQLVVAHFPTDEDDDGVRTTWRDDPCGGIALSIESAVRALGLEVEPPPRTLGFCELLAAWNTALGSDLLLILDQFEEYLLYHEGEEGEGTLATELPRALGLPSLRVRFLISIREDALARLDRFKGRIPTLFDNYIRIHHLDRNGARDAILKPIDKYNELARADPAFAVQPELVKALLGQLETGRVLLGVVGAGVSEARDGDAAKRVETPYLQLVMTRLWKEEQRTRSTDLRLSTLTRLGGCERIVKTHLDGTMKTLPRYSRYVAARVFNHLVTPSGTKIAHRAVDLAAYVGLTEEEVEPVLERLTSGDSRILRRVSGAEGDQAPTRYEIFHDVLAAAILDWRARYLRAREALQSVRRGATGLLQLAIGISWLVFLGIAIANYDGSRRLLFVTWAVCALVMWLSATVVLIRRWRRRTAAAVPLVGAVASALGPVTAAITVVNVGLRLWSAASGRLRGAEAVSARRSRPADEHPPDDLVPRFSGLMALIGAGILVAACLLPSVSFELWDSDDLFAHSLVAHDERLWYALTPLVCAAAIAATAVVLLVRSPKRRFTSGLLAGLGVGALAFFLSYLADSAVMQAVAGYPDDDVSEATPRVGAYLGAVGAGLVLVAAATGSVLDTFATVLGAGRILGRGRVSGRAGERDRAPRRNIAFGALAFLGMFVLLSAGSEPSEAWFHEDSATLEDVSGWAVFQAVAPALAAAVVAVLVIRRRRDPRLCAGWLAGCGLACLALFAGLLGSAIADDGAAGGAGIYLGLAGSAIFLAVAGGVLLGGRVEQPATASVSVT